MYFHERLDSCPIVLILSLLRGGHAMAIEQITEALVTAIGRGATVLPCDVVNALRDAHAHEEIDSARSQLETMLENVSLAAEKHLPICQDTGIISFFIRAGVQSPWLIHIRDAIKRAILRASESVPLRPNTVDPFTGKNPGSNLGVGMPLIDWEIVDGDEIEIAILPKGGGGENMSTLKMLHPNVGLQGIIRTVVDHVIACEGAPCPPTIVGIGIGGGADTALRLAKRALLRRVGTPHSETRVASLEQQLLALINESGVGPMGLGGRATSLAVHIEYSYRHPASLPLGIVMQCWADRRATVLVTSAGEVEVKQ